ncbi:MAG: TolB-like translocation protein [Chloroflexia bacterium]
MTNTISEGIQGQVKAPQPRPGFSRKLVFVLLTAACLLFAIGYVTWAALRSNFANIPQVPSISITDPDELAATLRDKPHMAFLSTAGGGNSGPTALLPLDSLDEPRKVGSLECERVHFSKGVGICLKGDNFGTSFSAYLFAPGSDPWHSWELNGFPSRARISPDGRFAATTVFVSGHSYAEAGFSTETMLYDIQSRTQLGDLEKFELIRDGKRIFSADFNLWGVTFARDSNRFYATLATGDKTYLIEGDVAAKRAQVLHENVECPSISPDNTRIAYKKFEANPDSGGWSLYVLDLATMEETALAETRSIDDQVEWLDNEQILYSRLDDLDPGPGYLAGFNIMVVPADGSGEPRILVPSAYSPAVAR